MPLKTIPNLIYFGLHLKCLIFLDDINQTWILSTDFIKSGMKFRSVVAELIHADNHD